ncbi:MAG: hypothetical protein LBI87_02620, partial [Candidatus Accumulibacter sp.]|nr:hypothetical protein [Accumulibacter sp.]
MSEKHKARIALVSYPSLGDSLMYLLMAENLRLNGFSVTLFSSVVWQLRSWLPQVSVFPSPDAENLEATLSGFDLVILHPSQSVCGALDLGKAAQKWLLLSQTEKASVQKD